MVVATALTDTELVRRAQDGDRDAFQDLYRSYLPKIFDFSLGMLRNRADAEDVTSETFLRAVERLNDLREPSAFKGWLYSIARHAALAIIDGRKKAQPVPEHAESAATSDALTLPQPEERAEGDELRALLDEAAATLGERERTVYDLSVRHGLGSAEIARVLGVRTAYAYILVNRLKDSVNDALEAVLLARVGRSDCSELDALLAPFGAEFPSRARKAVNRHAKSCSVCGETKRRRASVPALHQGVAFAEPGAEFGSELGSKIDEQWGLRTPTSVAAGAGAAAVIASVVAVVVLSTAVVAGGAQRTLVERERARPRVAPAVEIAEPINSQPVKVDPKPAPRYRAPAPETQTTPNNTGSVVITGNDDIGKGSTSTTNDTDTSGGPSPQGPSPNDRPTSPSSPG